MGVADNDEDDAEHHDNGNGDKDSLPAMQLRLRKLRCRCWPAHERKALERSSGFHRSTARNKNVNNEIPATTKHAQGVASDLGRGDASVLQVGRGQEDLVCSSR